MAKPDDELDEEALEPEILDPSDDEVVELTPLHAGAEPAGSDEDEKTASTAVGAVTTH